MPGKYGVYNGAELFTAEGAIRAHRLVKPGTDKGTTSLQVVECSGQTDDVIGAQQNGEDLATGDAVILHTDQPDHPLVELGGTVSFWDKLVSDADGQAIASTTATHKYFGRALSSGVSGQKIPYLPERGIIP